MTTEQDVKSFFFQFLYVISHNKHRSSTQSSTQHKHKVQFLNEHKAQLFELSL